MTQWLAELKWNLYNCLKMAGCFVWSFQIRGVFDVFWWGFLSSWKLSSEWPNSCEGRGMYSLHHLRQKSMDNINYIYIHKLQVDVVVACCLLLSTDLHCTFLDMQRHTVPCDDHLWWPRPRRPWWRRPPPHLEEHRLITSTVNDNSGDNNTAHESHI